MREWFEKYGLEALFVIILIAIILSGGLMSQCSVNIRIAPDLGRDGGSANGQ